MKKQKRKMKVCQQGREDGNLGISFTQHLMMISKAEKSYIIRHLLLSLSSGKSVYGRAGETYGTGPPGRAPNLGHFSSVRYDGYWDSPDRAGTKTEQHPILKANVTAPLEVTTTKGKICKTTDQPIENNKHRIQPIKNKMQIFTNIKFKKIMKKQILILALFALAILSSTINSFGQKAVHYSLPNPLSCAGDPLHPIAGQEWTYKALGTGTGKYQFWATKDPDFIATVANVTTLNNATPLNTPTDLLTASTNYNTLTATDEVKITWSSAILSKTDYQGTPDKTGATNSPTFVAVYFKSDDGCSDNFKVWELDPINGFTIDVLAIDADLVTTAPAYTTVPETCLDVVRSAKYVSGTGITFDYGSNYMYFELVASNFSGSFKPTVALSGMKGAQAVASYEYTTDLPSAWGTTVWAPFVSGTTSIPTDATNTKDGVSAFIRVKIDHKDFEGISGETLTLTVDATNAEGKFDIVNSTCVDPGAVDGDDKADSKFLPRPSVTDPTMPTPNLIPGNSVN